MSNQATRLAEEAKLRAKNAANLPRDPIPRKMQLDACFSAIDALLALVQPARRPLPAGSVITYLDMTATVVNDDGGETIAVDVGDGDKQTWSWEFEGTSCAILSIPKQVQPAVSEEAEQRGLSLEEHRARMSPERRAAMENARPKVKAMLAELKSARDQSSSRGDEGMQHE